MISSPVLNELVRTLSSVPDPTGNFATSVRSLRVAENDLRRALQELQEAPGTGERQLCIARRNEAMQSLIVALQSVSRVFEQDAQ